MKYRLDAAHRAFFLEHGTITFEHLLTAEEAENCALVLDSQLNADLRNVWRLPQPAHLEKQHAKHLLLGRDMWRLSDECRKWTMDRRCAEIAKELTDVTPLRLLTDQRCGGSPSTWLSEEVDIEKPWTLENKLCFQGMVCGLLLCLRAPQNPASSFFGTKPGMGTYFSPKTPLSVDQILRGPEYLYMLIVYGKAVSVFVHTEGDLQMPFLRGLGYHYGDRLKDRLHPIVFR